MSKLARIVVAVTLVCLTGTVPADDSIEALREEISWTRYEAAFDMARRMLEGVAAAHGEDSEAWAERAGELIDVMYVEPADMMNTPAREEWAEVSRRMVEILQKAKPDTRALVAANNASGYLLVATRKHDDAVLLLDATRELAARIGDADGEATSLRWLGVAAKRARNSSEADRYFEQAVEVLTEAFGPADPRILPVLRGHSESKAWAGDFESQRRLAERAVQIGEESLGPDHPQLARALTQVGIALDMAGRYEEAAEPLRRAESIFLALYGQDHPLTLRETFSLGDTLGRSGRFEEAAAAFERVIESCERKQEHRGLLVRALDAGGIVWRRLGDFDRALWANERGVELAQKIEGVWGTALLGQSLMHLANDQQILHDDEAAAETMTRALELQRSIHGDSSVAVAVIATQFCGLRIEQGMVEEAGELCGLAEQALERPGNPGVPPEAHELWLSSARLRLAEGKKAEALSLARSVVDFFTERLGEHSYKTVRSRLRFAEIQQLAGLADEAAASVDRALASADQGIGVDSPLYVHGLTRRARLTWARRDLDATLAAAARASLLLDKNQREVIHALPESHAEAWLAAGLRPERLIFATLLEAGEQTDLARRAAWEWTLRRRGILLDELATRRRATYVSSPEVRAAWEELTRSRRRLAALWIAGHSHDAGESYATGLAEALARRTAAEEALARASAPFRERLRRQRAGIDEIAPLVPDDAVLVELVRIEAPETAHDVALLLRRNGETSHVDLGPSERIDRLVDGWLEALDATATAREPGELATVAEAGKKLRRAFWDPLHEAVGDVSTLLLVAEGAAHRISIGALPAEDGSYLAEQGTAVHLLGSARDLLRFAVPGRSSGRGVLALGAPDFGAGAGLRVAGLKPAADETLFRGRSDCIPTDQRDWEALPGTERELRRVSRLLGDREPVQLRLGEQASEERLRRELPGKRLLHLATHGFFATAESCAAPASTPLLRSGLVLAGANRREAPQPGADDGILTAEELVTLDLEGVELAVLSACKGGRGDVSRGEGVQGLRRALEIGGVASTVTGLWPVSDRWTERWMGHFYEKRLEGRALHEAARAASLHCLERLRRSGQAAHPYLWSGFVTAGDWR